MDNPVVVVFFCLALVAAFLSAWEVAGLFFVFCLVAIVIGVVDDKGW